MADVGLDSLVAMTYWYGYGSMYSKLFMDVANMSAIMGVNCTRPTNFEASSLCSPPLLSTDTATTTTEDDGVQTVSEASVTAASVIGSLTWFVATLRVSMAHMI